MLTAENEMLIAAIFCLLLFGIILLYLFFDVNYFLRIVLTVCWGRLFNKQKRILESTTNYGVCLTSDIDIFLKHMNNARYVRELDFARSSFYDRSGIFAEIRRRKATVVQGATSIRYRRPIAVFTIYKIITQLIYWDEKSLYLEHDFVSLSDDFVRAAVLSRQCVTDANVFEIIEALEPGIVRPDLPVELKMWLESMYEFSLKFKANRASDNEPNSLAFWPRLTATNGKIGQR